MKKQSIITYKGFDRDLTCRGFQYEIGKEYIQKGDISVCENGFHACESPLEVLGYYFLLDNAKMARFCKVEQSGILDKEKVGTKIASSNIKINAELQFEDLIKLGVRWIKNNTKHADPQDVYLLNSSRYSAQTVSSVDFAQIGSSGDHAKIGSSGDYAKIGSIGDSAKICSGGDYVKIGSIGDHVEICSSGGSAQIGSSGDYAQIGISGDSAKICSSGASAKIGISGDSAKICSSGEYAQIGSSGIYAQICSSGDSAQICSSGDSAQICSSGACAKIESSGENSVICCAGRSSIAKAKVGAWITLAEWGVNEEFRRVPKCVKTEYVDGERIKADTWYKLVNGEFYEIKYY